MFYLIEISTGDSKISGKAIYEYDSLNKAIASFHSKMGVAMKSDLYVYELLLVIDSEGITHKKEIYLKDFSEDINEIQ